MKIHRKINITAFLLLLMLYSAFGQENRQITDPLGIITDDKVLVVLQQLSHMQGRGSITAAEGRLLYDLIREKGYMRALEIGTSQGYSGLWIGFAMKQNNGHLVTLEINATTAEQARSNFAAAGLERTIEVITANALEEIPEIEGVFDFVFIDALQTDYINYLYLVRDRVVQGGAITAHDVISRADVLNVFLDEIQHDPDLKTTIHPLTQWGLSVSLVLH